MKDLIVHQVNITHYRLIELTKLADQAKPFYDWVERIAKKQTGSHRSLNEILMNASKNDLFEIIQSCYREADEKRTLVVRWNWKGVSSRESLLLFLCLDNPRCASAKTGTFNCTNA